MMLPSLRINSHRFPIAAEEHLVSAWVRLNLRSGLGYLPFYRVLRYWRLPKRQIRAQRVDGLLLNAIASHLGEKDAQVLARNYAVEALWSLSIEMDNRPRRSSSIAPAHMEHSALAFFTGWKLCPECVSADQARSGYSYWRRDHQLPSVVHCSIHGAALLSSLSLGHLENLTLPASWVNSCPAPGPCPDELQEWSRFVVIVYRIVSNNPEIASTWRKQITAILGLPDQIRQGDRGLFDSLSKTFEAQVGMTILRHLFKAYRNNRARRPNILWATLFDRAETIRHPVYWLVILFWLRSDLINDIDHENSLSPQTPA